MSSITAPSLQAYRAWIDPAHNRQQPAGQSAAASIERREKPVIINLSPEAKKLTAQVSEDVTGQYQTDSTVSQAADSYTKMNGAGAGRREAPFAHRSDEAIYHPPGGVIDRTI